MVSASLEFFQLAGPSDHLVQAFLPFIRHDLGIQGGLDVDASSVMDHIREGTCFRVKGPRVAFAPVVQLVRRSTMGRSALAHPPPDPGLH
eukprot:287079-Lingulodinium_polyedra.AAC.1